MLGLGLWLVLGFSVLGFRVRVKVKAKGLEGLWGSGV